MCAMCRSFPCASRCPNASEPEAVHKCSKCGCGIQYGGRYYDSPRGFICEDCVEDMTAGEFMKLIGERLSTA